MAHPTYTPVELSKLGQDPKYSRGRGEAKSTTRLIEAAISILQAQNPMTVRQLHYRLVGSGQIDNTKQQYKKVIRLMTAARRDRRCAYSWIVDRSRPEYTPEVWKDAAGYFETVKRAYRRDYWHDQPCHVEIWVEKDSIIGSIAPVTDELGVTVRVFRGFSSETRAHDIVQAFRRIPRDKEIHIFYLGDHDPSGEAIETNITARVSESSLGHVFLKVKRLAIHPADIRQFKLPPQRVKRTDTRHKGFLKRHGDNCVELDALPPDELRRRIREAITEQIDPEPWNRHVRAEEVERKSILDFADKMANLKPLEDEGVL